MDIEELAKTILKLPKEERQALLLKLEESEYMVSNWDRLETAKIEDFDESHETAMEWPLVVKNRPWRRWDLAKDESVTYDILAFIKADSVNLGHPAVQACIRRWQRIVAAQNLVPGYIYRAAKRHLSSISEMLISAAEKELIPRELGIILKVPRGEIAYLHHAMVAYRNLRSLRRKSLKERITLVKKVLEDVNRRELEGIAPVLEERKDATPWIEKVIEFLMQKGPCGRWEAWHNAYIAWRTGLAHSSVAKYVREAKKQVSNQSYKLVNYNSRYSDDPTRLFSQTLHIEKTWVEIEDPTGPFLIHSSFL